MINFSKILTETGFWELPRGDSSVPLRFERLTIQGHLFLFPCFCDRTRASGGEKDTLIPFCLGEHPVQLY